MFFNSFIVFRFVIRVKFKYDLGERIKFDLFNELGGFVNLY